MAQIVLTVTRCDWEPIVAPGAHRIDERCETNRQHNPEDSAGQLDATFYSFDAEGHPLSYGFWLLPVVVIAALGISLIAGVLFGFFPAFGSIRVGPAHVLTRQSRTSTTRSPFGRWLIGIQAATAVALVALASLLWASARTVVAGTSYESRHVALLRLRPRLIGYTSAKAQQFQHEVLRRLETLPQVESVSLIGAGAVLRGSSTNVSAPGSRRSRWGTERSHPGISKRCRYRWSEVVISSDVIRSLRHQLRLSVKASHDCCGPEETRLTIWSS